MRRSGAKVAKGALVEGAPCSQVMVASITIDAKASYSSEQVLALLGKLKQGKGRFLRNGDNGLDGGYMEVRSRFAFKREKAKQTSPLAEHNKKRKHSPDNSREKKNS